MVESEDEREQLWIHRLRMVVYSNPCLYFIVDISLSLSLSTCLSLDDLLFFSFSIRTFGSEFGWFASVNHGIWCFVVHWEVRYSLGFVITIRFIPLLWLSFTFKYVRASFLFSYCKFSLMRHFYIHLRNTIDFSWFVLVLTLSV